eukprot:TRINITY_DN12276_c0_g1_i1.p1 TRINITY_DN12276_c0_g1~~TRINITY_DN12276_c0_g1_i1.p1  ORF type:complete len:435 (+),score=76.18 TRINITY_DN12276_c0_g1_i1:99-1403(+)
MRAGQTASRGPTYADAAGRQRERDLFGIAGGRGASRPADAPRDGPRDATFQNEGASAAARSHFLHAPRSGSGAPSRVEGAAGCGSNLGAAGARAAALRRPASGFASTADGHSRGDGLFREYANARDAGLARRGHQAHVAARSGRTPSGSMEPPQEALGHSDPQLAQRREQSHPSASRSTTRKFSKLSEQALTLLSDTNCELAHIERRVAEIEQLVLTSEGMNQSGAISWCDLKTELAQLEAKSTQLEGGRVDMVYTSELSSGKEVAKEEKKAQLLRLEALFRRFEVLFAAIKDGMECSASGSVASKVPQSDLSATAGSGHAAAHTAPAAGQFAGATSSQTLPQDDVSAIRTRVLELDGLLHDPRSQLQQQHFLGLRQELGQLKVALNRCTTARLQTNAAGRHNDASLLGECDEVAQKLAVLTQVVDHTLRGRGR